MNEHELCCGTVADKAKLCAEVEQRDAEIAHLNEQLNKVCDAGCTPADAQKLREYNHALADEIAERDLIIAAQQQRIEELLKERNGALAAYEHVCNVALQCTAIVESIDGCLGADLIEACNIGLHKPYMAKLLAALKAQWQADILAEISLQVSASKPEATPIQIATAIFTESKRIRQRAQEAGDAPNP